MTRQEVRDIENMYLPYEHETNKFNLVHNSETGEAIILVYNPKITGITKLRDIAILRGETIQNLVMYYKTRSSIELNKALGIIRNLK